jgi:hypothetical protein
MHDFPTSSPSSSDIRGHLHNIYLLQFLFSQLSGVNRWRESFSLAGDLPQHVKICIQRLGPTVDMNLAIGVMHWPFVLNCFCRPIILYEVGLKCFPYNLISNFSLFMTVHELIII